MDKHNFVFKWIVTETNISNTEAFAEAAINKLALEGHNKGVLTLAPLYEDAAQPSLSVNLPDTTVLIGDGGDAGQVVQVDGAAVGLVDLSDSGAWIPSAGNHRFAVIVASYLRTTDNPQIDPVTLNPFDLETHDSYAIATIVGNLGADSLPPPAPTIPAGDVVLGGVILVNGQTTIVDADLAAGDAALIDAGLMARGPRAAIDNSQLSEPHKTDLAGLDVQAMLKRLSDDVIALQSLSERRSIFMSADITDQTPESLFYNIGVAASITSLKLRIRGAKFSSYHYTEMPLHDHVANAAAEANHDHGGLVAAETAGTPAGTLSSDGGHTPAGTVSSDGGHTPTGTLSSDGAHDHAIDHDHASGTTSSDGGHSNLSVEIGGFALTAQLETAPDKARYMAAWDTAGGADTAVSGPGISDTVLTDSVSTHTHTLDLPNFVGTSDTEAAHNHTFTGDAVANHNHVFTGDAVANHNHTFTGDPLANHDHVIAADGGHNHAITVDPNGPAGSGSTLNVIGELSWIDDLNIAIDGIDRTGAINSFLPGAQMGDGTAGHDLNTLGYEIDLFDEGWGLTAGEHEIEFSLPSGGGKIKATLEVNE